MRKSRLTLAAAATLGTIACSGQREVEFAPAESARNVAGQPGRAVANEAGIRLTADAQAWGSDPANLDEMMVPVQVTIQNRTSQPLRLSYDDFALVAPGGKRFKAVSPFRIHGGERAIATPMLTFDRFAVAPMYAPFYPGVEVWPEPITLSEQVTTDEWNTIWSDRLPTEEMLSLALPEGVLWPGGQISGFCTSRTWAKTSRRWSFEPVLTMRARGATWPALPSRWWSWTSTAEVVIALRRIPHGFPGENLMLIPAARPGPRLPSVCLPEPGGVDMEFETQ